MYLLHLLDCLKGPKNIPKRLIYLTSKRGKFQLLWLASARITFLPPEGAMTPKHETLRNPTLSSI